MAKKCYVVFKGRNPGIYHSWPDCLAQVHQFPGARYKGYATLAEGQAALAGKGASSAPGTAKKTSSPRSSGGTKPSSKFGKIKRSDQIDDITTRVLIYTDGACEPNPGESGSGIAVYKDQKLTELWYGLYAPKGTNQTAELNALYQALLLAKQQLAQGQSCAILSDSEYSLNCMSVWAVGWEKAGWKRKGNSEIKNLEIIQSLYALYSKLATDIQLYHVKAHIGIEGNELADRMSVLARVKSQSEFIQYPDLDIQRLLKLDADSVP